MRLKVNNPMKNAYTLEHNNSAFQHTIIQNYLISITKTFDSQLNWNSLLVWIQKSCSLITSLALFNKLSIADFSMLSNGMAFVFLLILWIDGGFRKAIPLYAPSFLSNYKANTLFIRVVFCIQIGIITGAIPLVRFLIESMQPELYDRSILNIFSILFCSEGIISLMRLLFHGYFWHRQFIVLNSVILLIEAAITAAFLIFYSGDLSLIATILYIKTFFSIILVCTSLLYLKKLLRQHRSNFSAPSLIPLPSLKDFFYHAATLWGFIIVKSLTERNFLVPLVTYIAGPLYGNTFKIVQETSLFFQRIILKTIGTADTSFFSSLKKISHYHNPSLHALTTRYGIYHSTKRISQLIGIVMGLYGCYLIPKLYFQNFSLPPFFMLSMAMTAVYLIEMLLMPYERILEVNLLYKSLLIAYIPYGLGILWAGGCITYYWVYTYEYSFNILWSIIAFIMLFRLAAFAVMRYKALEYCRSLEN